MHIQKLLKNDTSTYNLENDFKLRVGLMEMKHNELNVADSTEIITNWNK